MSTNRDIYLFVVDLLERKKDSDTSLAEYLRNVQTLLSHHADTEGLTPEQFMRALEKAYDRAEPRDIESPSEGFSATHQYLDAQIEDLEQMKRDGVFENKYAYFGVSAESGRYWYNSHTGAYLECGLAGSFGGWEPDDDSGRAFVPGEVMAMGDDGELKAVAPEEIERPRFELSVIPWEDIEEFLWCGANYE